MKGLSLIGVLVVLVHWSSGYSAYNRNNEDCGSSGACQYTPGSSQHNSRYSSSSSSATSSSSSYGYGSCCSLGSWDYDHLNDLREFANHLKHEYDIKSRNSFESYGVKYRSWSESIMRLTDKTSNELDAICRLEGEQLLRDMQSGLVTNSVIAQPNFYEWKSSKILQKYADAELDYGQQQTYDLDMSNFDEVKTYNYPAEVKVVDGKTIVVHQNVTEAHKRGGEGTYENPYITMIKRNRTVVTTNTQPGYTGSSSRINNLDKHPVHITVDTSDNYDSHSHDYQSSYYPGSSTVTFNRYNETIIRNENGTVVSGSEVNKKWVNGKLVYDKERPFHDEDWKREEREQFFWFLTTSDSSQSLLDWQTQEYQRLLALANRYNCTLEDIYELHQKELKRYHELLAQYRTQPTYNTKWKNIERDRLDWLICQNSLTQNDLERWQKENIDKLQWIARQYQITVNELMAWQFEELNRFNDENNSMIYNSFNSIHAAQQKRLEELIRQHNATIEQLQNSIKIDQKKLFDLSKVHHVNIADLETFLRNELTILNQTISNQHNQVIRLTQLQNSERDRLENIFKNHHGLVGTIDEQIEKDRNHLKTVANVYNLDIKELEKWQRRELERIQNEFQSEVELDIKEWQKREHETLKKYIAENELTVNEFQAQFINDQKRLQQLATMYKVDVNEIQEWLRQEINELKNRGMFKEVLEWQQQERNRLMAIVEQSQATVQDLELKLRADRSYLEQLADNYNVKVSEIEKFLKNEIAHLKSQGFIKTEELNEWQKMEREQIISLLQNNRLTVEEFELKLLNDRQKLHNLAQMYNISIIDIEKWIKEKVAHLQALGLVQIQEQLTSWQKSERERILALVKENNLSFKELEEKIEMDKTHFLSVAHQNRIRVEEIENWTKNEIQKLKDEGLLNVQILRNWQIEWIGNLTNMIKDRDLTVEEFHKWLLQDHSRLKALATQHNVQIEEIEKWVKNEEKRFIAMGLLKPNEKLTNWQEAQTRYLERITQQQFQSTEQLEERLRQDRELLEKLAKQYQIQVQEIESWMNKEITRLRDEGKLQINNFTAWQIAESERLNALLKQNKQWSVEELEEVLRQDRDHMQKIAFQHHISVEEIQKWINSELYRLKQQGNLNIQKLTQWQKEQKQHILNLLKQQSNITVDEFKMKIQKDRRFLVNLAKQYHVNLHEVEIYVNKVIQDLKEMGKFEFEKLKRWQLSERDYILNLLKQHENEWSTKQFEEKLRSDRDHLNQLADYYRLDVKKVEEWMIKELLRLRKEISEEIPKLSEWQTIELERLKQLIRENNRLNYVQFELELKRQNNHLQQLSQKYSVSVVEVEQWLREQLLNLKTIGEAHFENLTKWQEEEQKRLIALCLQQQRDITLEEFEQKLRRDRERIEKISIDNHVSVQTIEQFMKDELERLNKSGLVQVQQLSNWQKIERQNLQDWLMQQHKIVTTGELDAFFKRDKDRMERIAKSYNATVAEIRAWFEEEGARLKLLGLVKGPNDKINNDWERVDVWFSPHSVVDWKEQSKAYLLVNVPDKPLTWSEFELYLNDERLHWEQFARECNINIREIETWLRQVAQGLVVLEEWQIHEHNHLLQLIEDKSRHHQEWSIEELKRQLINDHIYLQRLRQQFHLSVEEITEWYTQELQKLLIQRKIVTENLTEWQKTEKDRLYELISRNPYKTQEQWEQEVLSDQITINRICDQNHVTIEEVEIWIRNEIKRLGNLGVIKGNQTGTSNWQEVEKQRLRSIAAEISITEEEFLEFIAQDDDFQRKLTLLYSCSLEQLVPFQKMQIVIMNRERLLDRTALLKVESWQKKERDRLYSFIKYKNYNLDNLRNWQNQEVLINNLAGSIGITSKELVDWQIKEFERLQHLAQYYQITLSQLQDFRDQELRFIAYVMHKKTATDKERSQWSISESRRYSILQRKSGVQGIELVQWRRKLYLICQGRLPFSYNGTGTTNRTAPPNHTISKDRGDQPPNVFDEIVDNDEPGVADPRYELPSPPSAQIRQGQTQHSNGYSGYGGYGGYTSGGRYSRNEYEHKQPNEQMSEGYSHHYKNDAGQMQAYAMTADDYGQQQEQIEDDYGQQVQLEDGSADSSYSHGSYNQQQQQQVEVEDLDGTFTDHQTLQSDMQTAKTQQIEVQAEPENPGLLGRLKNKLFG